MSVILPYRGDTSQLLLFKIASALAASGGGNFVGSFNGRMGAVTLTSNDVTTALGYTPLTPAQGAGYVLKTGDTMTGALTIGNGILAASAPALVLSQTWNNAAVAFSGLTFDITNTASLAGSFIFSFLIGGSDRFSLSENGQLVATRQNLTNSAMAFSFQKRGNNLSATGNVLNNGALGNIVFKGWTGSAFVTGGSMATIVEGDWSGTSTGMSIQFQVTANGVFNNPVNILNLSGAAGISLLRSVKFVYAAKTATYTLTEADYAINCTANTFTVNLPTAIGIAGREYVIKNSGVGIITIDPFSTQTIDGLTTQNVGAGASATIMSDGANWIIV